MARPDPSLRQERGVARRRGVVGPASCAAIVILAGACHDDVLTPPRPEPPEVLGSVVEVDPDNVLSAIVTAEVRFADSVAVRYGVAGEELDSRTPSIATRAASAVAEGDLAVVPVLGLEAETGYQIEAVAYGAGQLVYGETLVFSTGTLPTDLPQYVASGSDPSPGYVIFAAGKYGLAIDNSGRVVWYHRFPDGPGLNFMAQPTGRYVARPTTPDPTDLDLWVEVDPMGNVTRTFGCARDLQTRFHDLIAEPEGSYWLLCDETRTMDLTAVGGASDARVIGTGVQHLGADGELLFEWSPFDHFEITDLDPADRTERTVNWTHGNALDLDQEGNLLVSFRSLSEITKIDTRSGTVLWRMGGIRNQFRFESAAAPAFVRQHGLRVSGAGELTLLDNLGDPAGSRAERYLIDEASRSARLVGSYGPNPGVTAQLGGTTQNLPGGRTLVAFGSGGRVEEYDASGASVWRIEGNPGFVFRAQRIRSLYHPGTDSPR